MFVEILETTLEIYILSSLNRTRERNDRKWGSFFQTKRVIAIIPRLQHNVHRVSFSFSPNNFANFLALRISPELHGLKACYICTYCFAIMLHNIHTKDKVNKVHSKVSEWKNHIHSFYRTCWNGILSYFSMHNIIWFSFIPYYSIQIIWFSFFNFDKLFLHQKRWYI